MIVGTKICFVVDPCSNSLCWNGRSNNHCWNNCFNNDCWNKHLFRGCSLFQQPLLEQLFQQSLLQQLFQQQLLKHKICFGGCSNNLCLACPYHSLGRLQRSNKVSSLIWSGDRDNSVPATSSRYRSCIDQRAA